MLLGGIIINFLDFKIDDSLKEQLSVLENCSRLPHAIIINGGSREKREQAVLLLSMWAVCGESENKPCGKCKACINAGHKNHGDVYFAQGSGKTGSYSVDEIRKINENAYTKANSAPNKVYVFSDADSKLGVIPQNTLLKTLEEPPKNVIFILTTENCKALLPTILSRATVFSIPGREEYTEEALENARLIVRGIIDPSEIKLLFGSSCLTQRDYALEVLPLVSLIIRDGLAFYSGGKPILDGELAKALAKRLTKSRLIKLIELTEQAIVKINQNVNLNLLATWLCGEYRRISWQK